MSPHGDSHTDPMTVYRRLLSYAWQHWAIFVSSIIAMVLYAATDTGFAALMKPLLDGSFVERDSRITTMIPIMIIVLFLVRGVAGFVAGYTLNWVGRKVINRLRSEVFDHLLNLPSAYYDGASAGVLLSKLTYNIEQVADSSTKTITILIRDTLTIAGLLAWMLYLSPRLAFFIIVIGPVIGILILLLSKRFRRYSARIQDSMGSVTRSAEQVISAQRVIKIFNGQRYEKRRFHDVNEHNRRLHMRLAATKAGSEPIIMLTAGIGVAGIIAVATRLDSLTAGTFTSFLSAMLLLMAPLKRLTNINASLQQGIAAGQSIFELLDEGLEPGGGERHIGRARGEVAFRDVSFAYDAGKGPVLKGIDLDIAPGQTVALVGRSGSGKSTLVGLLPRFYDPTEGSIVLDGHDIREYGMRDLREQISLVSQDVTLFNDTIAHNIAYGGLDGASPEKVERAARAAHVLEFTRELPEGLDTMVGDRGVLLSGGQRQRIAIARALLKDAPILILDEATSALDTESEFHIKTALNALMHDRTTLVIAHRLSTVESADSIVVLHAGRIVEMGTHEGLVEADGHYAALYRMQFNETAVTGSTDTV